MALSYASPPDPTPARLPLRTACRTRQACIGWVQLVAVMDDVLWPTLSNCHLHRGQHQLGMQCVGHRPAHNLAAPRIKHHGQTQEPGCCRHIGDVGDPELVRPRCSELAVHQIRRRPSTLVAPCRHRAAPAVAGTHQPGLPHQPRDPLAAVLFFASPQLGVDARSPVGLPRTGMHGAHPLQQRLVGNRMSRWRPTNPGVVASLGHAEHAQGRRPDPLGVSHRP